MKKQYRPYVSLDIEATGVGPEVDVLQIAMIFDEPGKPIEELSTFDLLLNHKNFKNAEPMAMFINKDLIEILKNGKDERIVYPRQAINRMIVQLQAWSNIVLEYDEEHKTNMKGKHIIAGKNAAGYDKPKLLYAAETYGNKSLREELQSTWVHRTLDPGSMYFDDFGLVPSMEQINKLLDRKEVTHNAVDDALDVIYSIRNKYKTR
jgi:hypothetical protein